eukprot:4731293-Pyramimonas_sp.AAC.1
MCIRDRFLRARVPEHGPAELVVWRLDRAGISMPRGPGQERARGVGSSLLVVLHDGATWSIPGVWVALGSGA